MARIEQNIFVLHQNGADSHYIGLVEYAADNNKKVIFREFSVLRLLVKGFIKLNKNLILKQFINFFWLVGLLLKKNQTIVVGIAPFDWRLVLLIPLFHKHKIYYHTSWTYWDGSKFPKKTTSLLTKRVEITWKKFLEQLVIGIFTVTESAKRSLVKNYSIRSDIYVVYHSLFDNSDLKSSEKYGEKITLVYVGRLVEEKGINEIIELSNKLDESRYTFKIVGSGPLRSKVNDYAATKSNLFYLGKVNNKNELAGIYNSSDILLLPSKQTVVWEELFGMVLIEAMSFGVIPISTNHVGPKEIITHGVNGFLMDESSIVTTMQSIIENLNTEEIRTIQNNSQKYSENYIKERIKGRWRAGF